MPLRVLHVDSGRQYRGGQNQVRLLVRELAREEEPGGLEQRLITSRDGELARRAAAFAPVVPVSWTIGLDPRVWWALRREERAFRPDIVHAHDGHALRLARWDGGRRAFRLVATRRVSFPVHRGSPLRGADAVIAISRAVRAALLAGGVSPAAIAVVPDGIDPDEVRAAGAVPLGIRSRLGLPVRAPLAVNVAALEPAKDQRTLVRAAHAARELRPDLHWVIAGEGKLRRPLQDETARLGLRDRVHFVGYIPEADGLIREADVFVMSSQEEGLGTVVLHALALGKPVVATRGGGLPEIVPAEWLVPVGDAVALARKVLQALDHPSPFPLPPQCTAPAMAAGVLALYRSLV